VAIVPVIEIDGSRFNDLAGLAEEFSTQALVGNRWHGNLDALNDILRGGFGTPKGGFTLRWLNSTLSAERLGYGEMITWLESIRKSAHPSNWQSIEKRLEAARRREGQTMFDMLIEIIRVHGPGGTEAEDNVLLELA
jgi:RNAse (barnase) inhibitor barstar